MSKLRIEEKPEGARRIPTRLKERVNTGSGYGRAVRSLIVAQAIVVCGLCGGRRQKSASVCPTPALERKMNILFVGDIFASPGRRIVADQLARIVSTERIHLTMANAENAAGGFGITPLIAAELFSYGLDILTSGNHIWDKKEIQEYLPKQPRLLRPANYPEDLPGSGVAILPASNGVQCAVINLQGRAHMQPTECPFRKADQILRSLDSEVKVRIVDFHAEATSEKVAMGWYLDGRVSAVIGTHTHVPTADTRILPRAPPTRPTSA